jgi:hypothetical protein
MKNSGVGQIGIKSSVRRSVSILLIFAAFAVSNSAKAADFNNNVLPGEGTNIFLADASYPDPDTQDRDTEVPLLAQQGAPWCYTDAGAFPMRVALPAGVPCHVNVPYYPYVFYGITGF